MMMDQKTLTEDRHFPVERISQIYVRGNEINGTFDVTVSELDWTEADATAFISDICGRNLDLYRNNVYFTTLSGEETLIGPATVMRISLWWKRQLKGRELREKLEEEFASRRDEVIMLLSRQPA